MDNIYDTDPAEQRRRELGEHLNQDRDEFAMFFEDWLERKRDRGLWSGDLEQCSRDAERIASAAMRAALKLINVPPGMEFYVSLHDEEKQ